MAILLHRVLPWHAKRKQLAERRRKVLWVGVREPLKQCKKRQELSNVPCI